MWRRPCRRTRTNDHRPDQNLLVFKTPYRREVHKLRIKARIDVFKQKLQRELGEDVLQEVKVVIAHPVDRCLFQDTYKFSFVRS